MSLMWPGPIDQGAYDVYVETWHEAQGRHAATRRAGRAAARRLHDGARDRADREGGTRHRPARHGRSDAAREQRPQARPPRAPRGRVRAALGPLQHILATSRTRSRRRRHADQIAERFAGILEPGLVDYIVLQLPTGDMTFDEAKRTMDLFGSRGQAELEKAVRRLIRVRPGHAARRLRRIGFPGRMPRKRRTLVASLHLAWGAVVGRRSGGWHCASRAG